MIVFCQIRENRLGSMTDAIFLPPLPLAISYIPKPIQRGELDEDLALTLLLLPSLIYPGVEMVGPSAP